MLTRTRRVSYLGKDLSQEDTGGSRVSPMGGRVTEKANPLQILPPAVLAALATTAGAGAGVLSLGMKNRRLQRAIPWAVGAGVGAAGIVPTMRYARKLYPNTTQVDQLVGGTTPRQVLDAERVARGDLSPVQFRYLHDVQLQEPDR